MSRPVKFPEAPDTLNGVEFDLLERRTRYPFPEKQRVRVNGVEAWYVWAGIEWLLIDGVQYPVLEVR